MSAYSMRQEKRVTIQTYKPTAQSLLTLLKEHDENTDTELSEWQVDIEKFATVPISGLAPMNSHRWEITLTRNIK